MLDDIKAILEITAKRQTDRLSASWTGECYLQEGTKGERQRSRNAIFGL